MIDAAQSSPKSDTASNKTVLVVEDEVGVRTATAEYLRGAGFAVIEATNADEAIAVFRSQTTVDVVFADILMPGSMDGFMLERWIIKNRPGTPVLFTSAVTAIRAQAMMDYGRRFLIKPFIFADVERRIRDLLES